MSWSGSGIELALIVTTAVSVVLAAGMSIVAWRLARAERLRSASRIAALAAGLREVETVREQAAVGIRAEPARLHPIARRPAETGSVEFRLGRAAVPGEMFRAGAADRSGSRLAAVLAVGSFAVATSLALVIVTSRGGPSIAEPVGRPSPAAQPASGLFLELAALSHERDGDRITIRGIVRNPPQGAHLDELTAVVYLFDRQGGFLGNGGAAMEVPALRPGAESAFVVHTGPAANVGRYRVSFKAGDRVVSHVDRRNPGERGPTQ